MNTINTKNEAMTQENEGTNNGNIANTFMSLHMSALSFLQERSLNLSNNTQTGEGQTTKRKNLLTLINMKNQTKKQILTSCLIALSSLFLASGAIAATITSKTTGGDWNSGATWNGGSKPSSSDSVVIDGPVSIASGSTFTFRSITINTSKSLTITGTLSGAGSGFLTNNGSLIVNGTLNGNTSSSISLVNNGTFTINTSGRFYRQYYTTNFSNANSLVEIYGIFSYNSTTNSFSSSSSDNIFNNLIIGTGVSITTNTNSTNHNFTVLGTLTVSGTFSLQNTGSRSINNLVINSTGTFSESGSTSTTITGNITNNGTYTSNTSVHTLTGSSKTINGTVTIPSVTINGSYTNNANLTIATALAGTGSLTQGTTGSLTLGGTNTISTFNASAAGNTVTYNGASGQTVKNVAYANLVVIGAGKSMPTLSNVAGNFELSGGANYTTVANLTIAKDLIIGAGSTFTVGSQASPTQTDFSLTIQGNYTNNGTFVGNTAAITFNGTAAQTIGGTSSNDFKYMVLNNAAGLTLNANVNIFKTLTVTLGNLAANGKLTIKSKDVTTSTGTAQVTQLPASGASITGNVTVERFIPAGLRSYRHLSCPVNSVSIFNSWQEAGANNAGYGVQITGPTANRANIGAGNAANGLDYTAASAYSMYTMTTSNVMSPVTDTKTTNFTPGLGYNIYIRGDRTNDLYNTSVTTNTQTTLRATGLLNQGDVTISLCNGWNIIGNPYASTIAWNASGWNDARGANIGATVYILNPAIVSGTINRFACHNGVIGTNGWPATGPYIESGQGFYVYTTAATSITFKEEYKTTNQAVIYFKNNSIADLLRIEYLSNGVHQDDIAINFREGGKTILDRSVDAETMASATNGIASMKNASRLAINTRPVFETLDTVALSVMSTTTGKFSLKFTELESFAGMTQVILVDKFLNKMVNVDQNVTYNFDITANPNSKGNNRFVLLFSKVGTTAFTTGLANATEEVSNVSLYPNPATSTINLACSNAHVRDFSYEIYNQMGQSVSNGAGNFANGNVEAVNIENLDKGIYFVKMFYNNSAEIIRFVK